MRTVKVDPTMFGTQVMGLVGDPDVERRLGAFGFYDRVTALYRYYAANGDLLYVGITSYIDQRWTAHRRKAPWFHLVDQLSVEWYGSEHDALPAELSAIKTERPLYNKRSAVRV